VLDPSALPPGGLQFDCHDYSGTGVQQCPVAGGGLMACAPLRRTTALGQVRPPCSLRAAPARSGRARPCCLRELQQQQRRGGAPPPPPFAPTRAHGAHPPSLPPSLPHRLQACVLPFTYRGANSSNCVDVAGTLACPTLAGWQACAETYDVRFPAYPANFTRRYTAGGGPCAAPFVYNGSVQVSGCLAWARCLPPHACLPVRDRSMPALRGEPAGQQLAAGPVVGML
jgi:hypothetical protein